MEQPLCNEQSVDDPGTASIPAGGPRILINGRDLVDHASSSSNLATSRFTLYLPTLRQHVCASGLDEGNADESGTRLLSSLEHYNQTQELVWLDVCDPTESELDTLASLYKFHDTIRADIKSEEKLETVKLFRHSYFVRMLTANNDPSSVDFLKPTQLYVIISLNSVLTISYESNTHARNIWNRICTRRISNSFGPDDVCCALIDDVVSSFSMIIDFHRGKSEVMDELKCATRTEDNMVILQEIGRTREQVLGLSRLLARKPDVVKGMMRRITHYPPFDDLQHETKLYLGDIQDHIITLISNVGHVAELLNRNHTSYVAQLSVQRYKNATHTSKIALQITALATMIAPIFVMIALLSLRCHTPGQGIGGYAWFCGITGFTVAYCLVALGLTWWLRFL